MKPRSFFLLLIILFSFNLWAFDEYLKTGINGEMPVTLSNGTSYNIGYTLWTPGDNNNQHVIIYNHGMQSHRAWENETFEVLRDAGFTIFAFDRIGSGTSSGEWNKKGKKRLMGHIKSWQSYTETLKIMIDRMKITYPDAKVHLWANSYGAKIVTAYLLQNKDERIASTVFTTPGLYRNLKTMPLPEEWLQLGWGKIPVIGNLPLFKISDDMYFPSTITEENGDNGAHWFTSMDPYFDLIKNDTKSTRQVTKSWIVQTDAMDKFIAQEDKKEGNNLNGTKRYYLYVNNDPMMDNNQLMSHINRNPVNVLFTSYTGGQDHRHFLPFTDDSEKALSDIQEYLLNN